MRAAILAGSATVQVKDLPDPKPAEGEALVRVAVSAICGSELHAYRSPEGAPGSPAGHEMVGEVVAVNRTQRVRVGDRVAVQVMAGCGRCGHCAQGDYEHCRDLRYAMGGHADLVPVPEMCCLPLPDDVSWETGVLLGGDTIGTTYRALRRLNVSAFDTVGVFGCGPIGLGMLAVLRFLGVRAIAADLSAYRRDLASKLGAWRALDPGSVDIGDAVRALTDGSGVDVALDCSPSPATLTAALDAVRVFGRVGLVGEKGSSTIHPSDHFIRKEITALGSWYFTAHDYFQILELHRRGLQVDDVVTHRFPFEEADRAFATFASGQSGKVLLIHGT